MSTTLAVANQKGGVAKTTTVASLGAALAEQGQQVLLVDLDPQACLTFSLGIDPEDLEVSVHHVLTKGLDPTEAIIETDDGVDLLPATIELARAEADLLTRTGREYVIRTAVEDAERLRLGAPRLPALAGRAHRRRADGRQRRADPAAVRDVVPPWRRSAARHRARRKRFTNRELEVWGVLPTLYDGRTNHARAVLETISETYDLAVIEPPIPKSIRFAEAPAAGRSILKTSRSNKGAQAYRDVGRTAEARLTVSAKAAPMSTHRREPRLATAGSRSLSTCSP